MSTQRISSLASPSTAYLGDRAFIEDMVCLFNGTKQGHLETWEYAEPVYSGDPAGGSAFWESLVAKPGAYYLTQGEIDMIAYASESPFIKAVLKDVSVALEYGPGSPKSIKNKTITFLKYADSLHTYIAVDTNLEQGRQATTLLHTERGVHGTVIQRNFIEESIERTWAGKTAAFFWGSSIGNIAARIGEDPMEALVQRIKKFATPLIPNDVLVLGFDLEQDAQKVLAAYSEMDLRSQVLSPLHRLKRTKKVEGFFDPRVWRHKPIFHPEHGQLAHVVFPLFDQSFQIGPNVFRIPAGTEFVSNNSFKLSEHTMRQAATMAGLSNVQIIREDSMALLIAER